MLGIIYLMFLSGLEIDFNFDPKKSEAVRQKRAALDHQRPRAISAFCSISLALSWIISLLGYTKNIFL